MRTRSKLLLVALTTTAVFSLAVSAASARRLEVSEQRFLAIWTSLNFSGGFGPTVLCPVTLAGSFHSRTISKVSGQLVGYVTEASVDSPNCTNGHATVRTETLAWHVQYNSFTGTLPEIGTIKIQLVGARFRIEDSGVTCESTTSQSRPAFGTITREANGGLLVIRAEGSIPCGIFIGTFEGNGEVFVQGPTDRKSVV